ncbi:hypothetical protein MLD38_003028 [Melastoma candidum]|uniref:Uncharacterized protein n=1 Tax=Melastoma candidum TaxID=119954 RepID=A0ACB9S1E7_9MYRT|nr:hypothetical protein MLD38_003028 [Melastoma candidum]
MRANDEGLNHAVRRGHFVLANFVYPSVSPEECAADFKKLETSRISVLDVQMGAVLGFIRFVLNIGRAKAKSCDPPGQCSAVCCDELYLQLEKGDDLYPFDYLAALNYFSQKHIYECQDRVIYDLLGKQLLNVLYVRQVVLRSIPHWKIQSSFEKKG